MDNCRSNMPHPVTIVIYQNGYFREEIPYENYPMPFVQDIVTIDGKQCIKLTPVVTVHETYRDSKGNYVNRDKALRLAVEAYDKDDNILFNADGVDERNQ